MLVVTHDERIAGMADRVICLEDGEVTKNERKGKRVYAAGLENPETGL